MRLTCSMLQTGGELAVNFFVSVNVPYSSVCLLNNISLNPDLLLTVPSEDMVTE